MYLDLPLIGEEITGAWNVHQSQEFNISSDRKLFNTVGEGSPVYEGKMIFQLDHKFAEPKLWIESEKFRANEAHGYWRHLRKRKIKVQKYDHEYYRLGFRRVAASTNERSLIAAIVPKAAACTD